MARRDKQACSQLCYRYLELRLKTGQGPLRGHGSYIADEVSDGLYEFFVTDLLHPEHRFWVVDLQHKGLGLRNRIPFYLVAFC